MSSESLEESYRELQKRVDGSLDISSEICDGSDARGGGLGSSWSGGDPALALFGARRQMTRSTARSRSPGGSDARTDVPRSVEVAPNPMMGGFEDERMELVKLSKQAKGMRGCQVASQ